MLRSLFPRAYEKYLSLPLLGPIADGFDDWLANNGFTKGSRVLSIHLLPVVDANLRRRGVQEAAKLNHAVLEGCCQALKKKYPFRAGTVHTLERYLIASAVMLDGPHRRAARSSDLSEQYTAYLRDVPGFAASTISSHRRATQCFLRHLEEAGTAVRYIRPADVESYVVKAGKRLSRGALQHEIAALRGFLRFLSVNRKAPGGLDRRIDTPRLYRLEQMPRALPWDTVRSLLQSLDTTTAMANSQKIHAAFRW